jgi:hypothetical protein
MITPNEARKLAAMSSASNKVCAALFDLAKQVEDLQADAMRYRWIRLHPAWETEAFLGRLSPEEFDAAIGDQMRP